MTSDFPLAPLKVFSDLALGTCNGIGESKAWYSDSFPKFAGYYLPLPQMLGAIYRQAGEAFLMACLASGSALSKLCWLSERGREMRSLLSVFFFPLPNTVD
ncbi:hypothetical protein ISCGN_020757 [Ixodes scapularis]